MNITVTGMGYVGLVTAACLAEVGHQVTGFDIDENKIASLLKGELDIYEPGLKELIVQNLRKQQLIFTSQSSDAYQNPDCILITVGTPDNGNGTVNLSYVYEAVQTLTENLQKSTFVAIKSTVPVGTCEKIQQKINKSLPNQVSVKVVSNPEFLREGSGIYDTFHSDRIIIGTDDELTKVFFNKLYQPFNVPIVHTQLKSAEMVKYASNAFLATKISFINEVANLCELSGADIKEVANGIGLDKRIGNSFLNAGIGYGGTCFPKDTTAFVQFSEDNGYQFEILKATIRVNQKQRKWLVNEVKNIYKSLKGLEIAVLGLSFKPHTDDLRGAPSVEIIEQLLLEGAKITVYDPVSSENIGKIYSNVVIASTIEEAIQEKKVALILTEWPEIKEFNLCQFQNLMRTPIILDGRNCYSLEKAKQAGITYYSVGRMKVNSIN
jgi:UDPglucose 6-dehydrogenase